MIVNIPKFKFGEEVKVIDLYCSDGFFINARGVIIDYYRPYCDSEKIRYTVMFSLLHGEQVKKEFDECLLDKNKKEE